MENKINEKIKRFVLLSKEFTVSSEEIYEGFSPTFSGNLTFNSSCSSSNIYYTSSVNTEIPKTKLEQYKENLEEKINIAERYEEFLELQIELSTYFDSMEKLIK